MHELQFLKQPKLNFFSKGPAAAIMFKHKPVPPF